jgi:hypothetical protein
MAGTSAAVCASAQPALAAAASRVQRLPARNGLQARRHARRPRLGQGAVADHAPVAVRRGGPLDRRRSQHRGRHCRTQGAVRQTRRDRLRQRKPRVDGGNEGGVGEHHRLRPRRGHARYRSRFVHAGARAHARRGAGRKSAQRHAQKRGARRARPPPPNAARPKPSRLRCRCARSIANSPAPCTPTACPKAPSECAPRP